MCTLWELANKQRYVSSNIMWRHRCVLLLGETLPCVPNVMQIAMVKFRSLKCLPSIADYKYKTMLGYKIKRPQTGAVK